MSDIKEEDSKRKMLLHSLDFRKFTGNSLEKHTKKEES